jgi:beta-lactamase class A
VALGRSGGLDLDLSPFFVHRHTDDLSEVKRQAWLVACKTGDARLRAGLPKEWRVGDKTGTGGQNTTNDVAVVWPKGRAPLVVAALYAESSAPLDDRNAVLAEVGRIVALGQAATRDDMVRSVGAPDDRRSDR